MNRNRYVIRLGVIVLILLLTACSHNNFTDTTPDKSEINEPGSATGQANTVVEYDLIEIPLPVGLDSPSKEYSGLAWYGEDVILLPQYPNGIYGNQDGFLYAVDRTNLSAYIADSSAEITFDSIPFDDAGLSRQLDGFEGFESLVFIHDSIYLTIETRGGNPMKSFVVKGSVNYDEKGIKSIQLDHSSLVELTVQNDNSNASYEALTSDGEFVYAFFEQNGKAQNENPYAVRLDRNLHDNQEIPLDFINYRLTDATLTEENGELWVINYFFPGDSHLEIDEDPISIQYGLGDSHQENQPVERLIKLRLTEKGILLADEPPIYLRLLENNEARNWEGIVRFGDEGFLLVTDKFPDSILGYLKVR